MRISSLGTLVACALMSGAHAAAPATSADPPWATHKDSGFSVEMPPGWTAGSDPQKGWVHLMGTQGEDVVIWPVFLPGAPADLDLRTAQSIHQKLAAACPYNAEWEVTKAMGSNIVRARGRSGEMIAVSAFTWKISPRGVAGYFYVAGARETDFKRRTWRRSCGASG